MATPSQQQVCHWSYLSYHNLDSNNYGPAFNSLARTPPTAALPVTLLTACNRPQSLTSCISSYKHGIKTQQTALDRVRSQDYSSLNIVHGRYKKIYDVHLKRFKDRMSYHQRMGGTTNS